MTENEIYNALHRGGAFTLPFLIKLSHPTHGALYFVNNNVNIIYDGNTYHASAFKYTRPQTMGGVLKNGTLEITAIENNVINLLELSDELFILRAVGVLEQNGTVTPIKLYKHQYGTVTFNGDMRVNIAFKNDDRPDMTWPPYIFDNDNNAGNA